MNKTLKETIIDTIIHDLEALDFNSKEARDVVSKALDETLSQKDLELKEMIEGMKANTRFMSKTDIRSIEETKGYNQFADDLLAKLTKE